MTDESLKLALEALENCYAYLHEDEDIPVAITAIKQALSAPVQEPVAWKWHQAPVKTSWGHEMVVADLAIDKDNTVSVYCERDQTAKAEAMFTPPAAQRQWVGLTDEEFEDIELGCRSTPFGKIEAMKKVEAKLKERNV